MSFGVTQKWLMGYNKPNSWDNNICFVGQDCYSTVFPLLFLYYSSVIPLPYSFVTEGPFLYKMLHWILEVCVISSFVTSNLSKFLLTKASPGPRTDLHQSEPGANVQPFPLFLLRHQIGNRFPVPSALHAAAKGIFLRHPGRCLSWATNPKSIYSNSMGWSSYRKPCFLPGLTRPSRLCDPPGEDSCVLGVAAMLAWL